MSQLNADPLQKEIIDNEEYSEEEQNNNQEDNTNRPKKKSRLNFGNYKVNVVEGVSQLGLTFTKTCEKEFVCKPLTQDEYAEGWQTSLPRPVKGRKGKKSQPVHHWSVSLAQLPPHLWSKYHVNYDEEGNKFYPIIKDNIYHYTVSESEHDKTLFQLKDELEKSFSANKDTIKELLAKLEGVNGWIITRARKFLKGSLDMEIVYA
jgi:hypothetical protein